MNHEKKELYTAKRTSDCDLETNGIVEFWNGRVRSDADPACWICLTVDAAKKVAIAGSGAGGLSELCASFSETDIFFGGVRVSLAGGAGIKFVHFFVVGGEVGAMKKGKASLLKNAIQGALDGAHGSAEVSAEVSAGERRAELARQIGALCGAGWSVGGEGA